MLYGFVFFIGFIVGFFLQSCFHAGKIYDQDMEIAYLKKILMRKDRLNNELNASSSS